MNSTPTDDNTSTGNPDAPVGLQYISGELMVMNQSILGYTTILLSGEYGALSKEQQEVLQFIQDISGRSTYLLQTAKFANFIKANRFSLHKESRELHILLKRAVRISQFRRLHQMGNLIRLHCPENIILNLDPQSIIAAATALLDFTHHYSVAEQQTVISVTTDNYARIAVPINKSVQETKDLIDTIMANDTSHPITVARHIIKMHNGDIHIEQSQREDTTLSIILPFKT